MRHSKAILSSPKIELINIQQFSKLAMIYWVGGTLTLASIVIPILFKTLNESTAAALAGQLLNINAYIGVIALGFALIDLLASYKLNSWRQRRLWYLLVMITSLTINYFAIFPLLTTLRSHLLDLGNQVIQHTPALGFWHSVSSILFLVNCILGVLYFIERP